MRITKDQLVEIIKEELDQVQPQGPRAQKPLYGKEDLLTKALNLGFDMDSDPAEGRHPKLTAILEAVKDAYGKVPMDLLVDFLRNLHREMAVNKKVMKEDHENN
tara:strand:- start:311 stop:622 length:312 start_codon:yes stop_codon:yes gene_type:complete